MGISLVEILKDILSEADHSRTKDSKEGPIRPAVKEAIKNAIENRWILNINYIGDAENAPGYRWVEPYVWGNNIYSGNEVLRAWQYKTYNGKASTTARTSKYSKNNPDGWRMFRLDRIAGTAPLTTRTFDKPRPMYNEHDKLMSGIKMAVDFSKKGPGSPGGNKAKNTVNRLKTTKGAKTNRIPGKLDSPDSPTSITSPGGIV